VVGSKTPRFDQIGQVFDVVPRLFRAVVGKETQIGEIGVPVEKEAEAFAGAAAVAAFLQSSAPVVLQLPGGKVLTIPINAAWHNGANVIKDGGDDPDVTTGCEIRVELQCFDGPPLASDYVENEDALELIIRGGDGVGHVTRPGLAVPVGKAAINPTPRKMLLHNLLAVGCKGRYLVTISVPLGEEIAMKTLNPTLGVVGGISILGNSGIVRPYSNAAYAATIALQLKSIAANGLAIAALVTGNRSADAVRRDYPQLPEEAIVRIGDFIYVAVNAAGKAGIKTLIIGCMPGKLFKYACGEKNTHAHNCKLTLSRLRDFGIELPGIALETMDTMGELATHLDEMTYKNVLTEVFAQAKLTLQQWAKNMDVDLILYDDAGRKLI